MTQACNKGLVTVIVSSYNHSQFLEKRIDSLLNQSYLNFEIIVIDDCSTENNLEILERYQVTPNFQLIKRKSNGGVFTVNNQGLEIGSGEYFIFANCDDSCDSLMIESLVKALESNNKAGLAFCRSLMIDEFDAIIGDDYFVREQAFKAHCITDAHINGNLMHKFLMHSCVIPNMSAALIRRSCMDVVGLFRTNFIACGDWDLFFRIAKNYDFAYVAKPLNFFRQHDKTIRNTSKGRVTYDEFFSILLPKINNSDFSLFERISFRFHVMYLWSIEMVRPSFQGWKNFAHHAKLVVSLDPLAISLLPFAMILRTIVVPFKLIKRVL